MPIYFKILICVLAAEGLGGLGAAITSSEITNWYAGLQKPVGTPPNWLFGPVWAILYALMGTAFAVIWNQSDPPFAKHRAMIWFGVQFILNLAWTPVFFGMHQMLAALALILAMWATIVMTMIHFRRLKPLAAALLLPYLLWVSYATYLNAGYWWLNRF